MAIDLCPGKLLPQELETLIQKLTSMFGPELHISPVKPEDGIEPTDGIVIEWLGRRPQDIFRRLKLEQNEIFGADLSKWQILCPSGSTPERGVQIFCLDTPKKRLDCWWGFWDL